MHEKHVGICVPVTHVLKGKRGTGNRLACQIYVVDPPRIRTVMIQIELIGSTGSLVWCGGRSCKCERVGKSRDRCSNKDYRRE